MLNEYVLLSVLSASVLLVLIAVVLKRDSHSRSNQVAAMLFSLLFLWSIFDAVQRATSSEETAFLAMTGILSIAIFVPAVFLHLSYTFPWNMCLRWCVK